MTCYPPSEPPSFDATETIEDTIDRLSNTLRMDTVSTGGDCEPLQQQVQEIKRLVRELPEPFDEETLKVTQGGLTELLYHSDLEPYDLEPSYDLEPPYELEPLPLPRQSLWRRFNRVMRRWLRFKDKDEHAIADYPRVSYSGLRKAQSDIHTSRDVADKLQEIISTLKSACRYAPRDVDDVLQTERILNEDLGLPSPSVWQIIEDAEYWVRSRDRRDYLQVIALDAEVQEALCCTATIPLYVRRYKPLRRVVFNIESRDQGWRLSNDRRSWTWFEVGGNIAPRRHIVHNIPASWERRVHRTQWDNSLHDGSPEDAQLLEWMSSIAGGQEVSVFARAQFRGWENHVHRVIIEVYCACV
ncbi:hypothetical protein FOMPIDRAFT_93133 [Fomitopsis schrenkii]|uniref:Uncharacterized protein n=1 Tax=Fomitopsis schrenkii TaxID=2126942 RepID=S8FAP7_FOMSC|nr:hypothetical protein FOMPIDRAFT_93133 [Fomitopsis schrenkii]